MHKNIFSLLVSIFLVGLLWIAIVPIWHTPDEQAHLGQVAFIAEKDRSSNPSDIHDLTDEIYISEQLLGTARDKFGNNKFTFHPEYRIEYTNTLVGKHEAGITALVNTDAKSSFVHTESTRYPLSYYIPASIIYRLFYQTDLFTRVFFVRIWSLLLFLGTIYITYALGMLLSGQNKLFAWVLAVLVAFQPMMMFVNIGVSSDAMGNFLFTFFIYLCANIIISGIRKKRLFLLLGVTILSIYTKPQFIILIPVLCILFFIVIDNYFKKKKDVIYSGFFLVIITVGVLYFLRLGPASIIIRFISELNISSLVKYSREYTIPHTIGEVLPWYWGIYNWLGVTYPRIIHRIINRFIIIALIGFILWINHLFHSGTIRDKINQAILFLCSVALLFLLAISFYDWLSWYSGKYSLGVQGRYLFPTISVHMLTLLIGWRELFAVRWYIKRWATKILGLSMIMLNFYGLYTVAQAYYDISFFSKFIIQASQYKPWFIKGDSLTLLIVLTVLVVAIGVILPMFRLEERNS